MTSPSMTISDEVAYAVAAQQPVVGLESSNLTGGSYPGNLELARAIDEAVREGGAVPARVGVVRGRLCVGLDDELLDVLARDAEVQKAGTRDLAIALGRGLTAGTTVSASLRASVAAHLTVFAVAGIGGVHRGAETSLDISTDLTEFSRSPLDD